VYGLERVDGVIAGERVTRSGYADHRKRGAHLERSRHDAGSLFRRKQPRSDSGARPVGAQAARAEAATDVADGADGEVEAAALTVRGTREARVTLRQFFEARRVRQFERCFHACPLRAGRPWPTRITK
jgi:hypothetical protein